MAHVVSRGIGRSGCVAHVIKLSGTGTTVSVSRGWVDKDGPNKERLDESKLDSDVSKAFWKEFKAVMVDGVDV
jgi:hypothetical protein